MGEEKQKILSEEERDAFRGTTIEENGDAHNYEDDQRNVFRDRAEQQSAGGFRGYSIHSYGCGTGVFILIMFLCVLAGMFFFLLPVYVIGALVIAAIYAISKYLK